MLEAFASAALRILLLALVLELCLRLARVRHPQLLLAAWTMVLAASLCMPILQYSVPVTVPITLPISVSASAEAPLSFASVAAPESAVPPAAGFVKSVVAVSAREAQQWNLWLTVGYFIVAGTMLFRLALGLVLSWKLLRTAQPTWEGWATGVRVHTSTVIAAPVTIGRNIVLPDDWTGWAAATQQAVLAHERAHVGGGDFYVLLLSQVNRALFWFSPLSWWLHYRLACLAEQASDDAAIEALGDGPGYAAILLDMARRSGPILGGVAMARPATLCQRLERILTQRHVPFRVSRFRRAALAFGVAPLAFAAALSIASASLPKKTGLAEQQQPHAQIVIDSKWLDAYAGYYFSTANGSVMIVTRDGDHLRTRWAGKPAFAEYPYTDHDFFLTVAPMQNSFVTDSSGAATGVVHYQKGESETLERVSVEEGQRLATAITQRVSDERTPHARVGIDPNLLDAYVGTYQLTPRTIFTITRTGNTLMAKRTGERGYLVHPYSDRDFFYTISAAQLSFMPGSDGRASALILHEKGRDRIAKRVNPASAQTLDQNIAAQRAPHKMVSIDPRLIEGYVGRYRKGNAEMIAAREGDQLFVEASGSGRYPVYPYSDKDFFATLVPAQISFATDAAGKATQLIRHEYGVDVVLNRVD